jgi:hypothetical protein
MRDDDDDGDAKNKIKIIINNAMNVCFRVLQ